MTPFNAKTAEGVLKNMREGLTVKESCAKERISTSDFLQWRRGENRIGERLFVEVLREAVHDLRILWVDEGVENLKNLRLRGTRQDVAEIRKIDVLSQTKLRAGKELAALVGSESGDDDAPTVIIKTFGQIEVEEKDDGVSSDESEWYSDLQGA